MNLNFEGIAVIPPFETTLVSNFFLKNSEVKVKVNSGFEDILKTTFSSLSTVLVDTMKPKKYSGGESYRDLDHFFRSVQKPYWTMTDMLNIVIGLLYKQPDGKPRSQGFATEYGVSNVLLGTLFDQRYVLNVHWVPKGIGGEMLVDRQEKVEDCWYAALRPLKNEKDAIRGTILYAPH